MIIILGINRNKVSAPLPCLDDQIGYQGFTQTQSLGIPGNRKTGKVRIVHLYGSLDAGQVVNPRIVEAQIMGQLVQTTGRMLYEEVKFTPQGVTTLDWNTYPVARFNDVPEITPIVVQRLDKPSSGAGEETMAAAAAAIANAFFDATGVRMEEYPFTPARVLGALNKK